MIRSLSPQVLQIRSDFLGDVRTYFKERNYIEVETPLLNPEGGLEPFIDPFTVARKGVRKSIQASPQKNPGYLITSPELNMKMILKDIRRDIFQISHCFREGDSGDLHSEEFLMLEWYKVNVDEFILMKECADLLKFLSLRHYSRIAVEEEKFRPVLEVMESCCECSFNREEMEIALQKFKLIGKNEDIKKLRYDEIFFTLFLNLAESRLGMESPEFIYHYPAELASLSKIEDNISRRFELYWKGIELANGYYEPTTRKEYEECYARENRLRKILGKEIMPPSEQFLSTFENNYPESSGIALGLDRLLMVLLEKKTISEVSPFF